MSNEYGVALTGTKCLQEDQKFGFQCVDIVFEQCTRHPGDMFRTCSGGSQINTSLSPQLTDQAWLPAGVQVPLHQVPYTVKGYFRFLPPAQVTVVGSYLLGTCIRPDINVDVALTMPRVRPRVQGMETPATVPFTYPRVPFFFPPATCWWIEI